MPNPLVMAGVGLGAKAVGAALGGGGGLPDWYIDILKKQTLQDRTAGFLPDKELFDADLQAQLDEFYAQLPVAKEEFDADLSRRGIYSSSEAPRELYRTAYAPIARAGTSAIARSKLGYAQMYQQGRFQAEEIEARYIAMLGGALAGKTTFGQRMGDLFGDLGDFGIKYGMLDMMGLFDEGTDINVEDVNIEV